MKRIGIALVLICFAAPALADLGLPQPLWCSEALPAYIEEEGCSTDPPAEDYGMYICGWAMLRLAACAAACDWNHCSGLTAATCDADRQECWNVCSRRYHC